MATKRNIRSIVEDIFVILICLAGMSLSLNAFVRELNRALVKFNEEPVATITFKYRSAQRRIDERVLWDRLRQESPIYNLDTIRTAERSEATLHFPDGNSVALSENTMIQVIVDSVQSCSQFDVKKIIGFPFCHATIFNNACCLASDSPRSATTCCSAST